MSLPVAAILVAAGQSRRFGTDKLWIDILGRPVWRWGLDALLAVPGMARVALVVPPMASSASPSALPPDAGERVLVVGGGEERTDSVVAGITALTAAGVTEETPVLVHDAARPAASPELMVRVVSTVRAWDGRVPLVPVADSLKTIDAARSLTGAVDRETVSPPRRRRAPRLSSSAPPWRRRTPGDGRDGRGGGHGLRRDRRSGGGGRADQPQAHRSGRRRHAARRARRLERPALGAAGRGGAIRRDRVRRASPGGGRASCTSAGCMFPGEPDWPVIRTGTRHCMR